MFIAHGDKFRKYAKPILGVFAVVMAISLVGYFTQTGGRSAGGSNAELPTIKGEPIQAAEFRQLENVVRAQFIVQQGRELRVTGEMRDTLKREVVLAKLMNTKAKELGIRVTPEEVNSQIASLPFLNAETPQGRQERALQFKNWLNNFGISQALFGQVIESELTRVKLQQLVTSAAKVTPTEVQQAYLPLHEKITIELVRFDVADFKDPLTISNEDVVAYYNEAKEDFATPEKVKVRYVRFAAADIAKTLTPSEPEITAYYEQNKYKFIGTNATPPAFEAVQAEVRSNLIAELSQRAAADKASEFAIKVAGLQTSGAPRPDLAKVAAEAGLTVATTDFLTTTTRSENVPGQSEDFVRRAFALSPESPFSDPITGKDGSYYLELLEHQPRTIPEFSAVEADVRAQVKRLRTYEAVTLKGYTTTAELKKLIAAGKTFTEACAALQLKIETPPAFTVSDEKLDLPAAASIQQSTLGMPVGGVSEFVRSLSGGVVFHLKDRQQADLAEFETNRERLTKQILQRNRQAMFNDWLRSVVETEQVDFKIKPRQRQPEEEAPAS